jgi:ABC-type uncharacterized transport system permease subunit
MTRRGASTRTRAAKSTAGCVRSAANFKYCSLFHVGISGCHQTRFSALYQTPIPLEPPARVRYRFSFRPILSAVPGNTSLLLLQAAVALYVLGFGYALAATARGREHHRPVFYAFILAGFISQSAGLYLRGLDTHSFPVANTFELLQALAWVTVFLKLILRATLHLRLLGLFASGLAALLGVASLLMPGASLPPAVVAGAVNPWIGFHIALALFSYGVFGLLAVTALMYLIQRHGLEQKRFSGIFRLLPSLAELDTLNRQLLLVGVWALSVAVILGVLDWFSQPGGVSATKLAVVVAVWAGYLLVGWLRSRNRLVAGAYAWTCVLLFAFAMFSLWPVSKNDSAFIPSGSKSLHYHH